MPNPVVIKKQTGTYHQSENKRKWIDKQTLGFCQRNKKKKKKLSNMSVTVIPNVVNALGTVFLGGARGVMVIVVGNGHGDTSSNPGPG